MSKTPITTRIDMRLAEIGMQKKEFFAAAGITSATYSAWNSGANKPTVRKLHAVSEVIGVPFYELMFLRNGEELPEQKEKPIPKDELLSDAQKYLLSLVDGMDDEQIMRLAEVMKAAIAATEGK